MRPAYNASAVPAVDDAFVVLPSGGALQCAGTRGLPLLFLHGVGGGAWSWKPQRAAFAETNRLFVWEARGHGDAPPAADAGLADYYVDAQEALARAVAEAGEPVVLVAHSMGGLLAFALARDHPASVAGLFLVDPVYATDDDYGHFSPRAGAIARALCAPLLHSFARGGRLSLIVGRWMFARAFEHRANMERAWIDQRRQIPFEYPRMLDESFGKPVGFELSDFASIVNVPVVLLEGTPKAGRMRFPALIARLTERLGKRFEHAVLPGGHYLQLDCPDELNGFLARFASRVASP